MANIMLKDTEKTHKAFYKAHWELTAGAQTAHDLAAELFAASRHSDSRDALTPIIDKLERIRGLADEAWKLMSDARMDLTKLTGCSGTCSDR